MTEQLSDSDFKQYFTGKKLYGDDFTDGSITAWFEDEAEGYSGLIAGTQAMSTYPYHSLNKRHGFSHLPKRTFKHALGFGSAQGDEFLPIADRLTRVTILEPSEAFSAEKLRGITVDYRKPEPSGKILSEDSTYDLITCLGVLHHIPNVTFVISEMARVLTRDGYALIREPVVNMGDWRRPRRGLTKRERGLPPHIVEKAIAAAGLTVLRRSPCIVSALPWLAAKFTKSPVYNSSALVSADSALSRMLAWNMSYDQTSKFKKLAPASFFWVVTKR